MQYLLRQKLSAAMFLAEAFAFANHSSDFWVIRDLTIATPFRINPIFR